MNLRWYYSLYCWGNNGVINEWWIEEKEESEEEDNGFEYIGLWIVWGKCLSDSWM